MGLLLNEVAQATGLHRNTIRRLEARGIISSRRDVNNWRLYSPETVGILKRLYIRDDQSPESDGPEPKRAA
jgi:DNA-binding transcriptional MerR regulator